MIWTAALLASTWAAPGIAATTYEVGPGKPYPSVGAVPWESLVAGDTVLIYYRHARPTRLPQPCAWGDQDRQRHRALRGRHHGDAAVDRHREPGDPRRPQPNTFTGPTGATETYTDPASSIYVEFGENITVRNCDLHDNGNVGSIFHHNVYVESIGITFQYNHLGPLLPGPGGNNLKDRSAGLVVRYNWIEGSNRQLDLVHAEDSSLVRADPRYRATHVYGNVLIEHPNSGNNDICFYGGDGGSANKFRKGTLYFYNNTMVSDRTDATRLFRMATNDESIDARNNIAYVTAAGANLQVLDNYGRLTLTQNWFKTGCTPFTVNKHKGTITDNGTMTGASPGFVSEAGQDYHLISSSPAIDDGAPLNPAVLPTHDVVREYVKHLASVARTITNVIDIGAYEF